MSDKFIDWFMVIAFIVSLGFLYFALIITGQEMSKLDKEKVLRSLTDLEFAYGKHPKTEHRVVAEFIKDFKVRIEMDDKEERK